MGSRADRFAVVCLLVLVVFTWLPRLKGPTDLRWDAAVYYILGTSLSEGKGYRLLNEPGEIRATIYPPLLPAVVAACQRALGTTDPVVVGRWLRGLFLVLSLAYVVAVYALLRRAARVPYALLGTFVCALTFLPVWLSDRCYTDLPFAIAAVLFVWRPAGSAPDAGWSPWLLASLAFFLRTIGIALLAAWVLAATARRRYRTASLRLAAAMVPLVLWQLYVHGVQASPEYEHPAYPYQRADYNIYNVTYGQLFSLRDHLNPEFGRATAVERASRAVRAIARIVPGLGGAISQPREHWELVFARLSSVPVVRYFVPWRGIAAAMTLLGLLVLGGLMLQLRRGEVLLPACALIYLVLLCAMPQSYFGELPRYLWVLSPLFMVAAFQAVQGLYDLVRSVRERAAVVLTTMLAAAALFIAALSVFTLVRAYRTDLRGVVHRNWNGHHVEYRLFSYAGYPELDLGLEWLQRRASPTDIVASTTPHWVYLRTRLKAVFPPFERDAATAQSLLDSVPVRYVVVSDWLSRERLLPIVLSAPAVWRPVFAEGECAIYERIRAGSPGP